MKFLPLGILLALCVLLAFGITKKEERTPDSPVLGKPLPEVVIDGESLQKIVAGHVAVVNVFASWCLPCALEQPSLVQLKTKNLAPIIGIAWKNKPEDVANWLHAHGNPYTHLLLDEKGAATLPLALTGVPETFIVDKNGTVAYHTSQPLTPERLAQEIIPLLERLQKP